MFHLHFLLGLSTKMAITDAVYHTLISFDRNGHEIFDSSMLGEDVIFKLKNGSETRPVPGLAVLKAGILGHVGLMDTTHMLSNIHIFHKEVDNTASLTAYAQPQHCPPGRGRESDSPKLMTGIGHQVCALIWIIV
ncbi:hypothetical protein OIDMADRAFT_108977 [Oidiodendron maius Zn]|uniref:Uncharacterized protein n=1 Tax=Oidiodendron maius (strain Zn) TaxID=913774 RepID=A0A0C3I4A2_OIDMZ|nr:hypothetical protein OIDMADRAFT_108977 [Oidiodendron maius Zn]